MDEESEQKHEEQEKRENEKENERIWDLEEGMRREGVVNAHQERA